MRSQRRVIRFVPVAALALLTCAVPAPAPASARNAAADLPLVERVLVEKAARRLTLIVGGRPWQVIEGIALGDEPTGPKRFAGDERTPEGRYTIDWGNPQSAYHYSLHISYPNAADTAYARARGRSPGGMIMIHGQPNDETGPIAGDWTDGCIAVTNPQMEMIWQSVPDGTPIDIVP